MSKNKFRHRKGRRVKGINMFWGAYKNGCDFLVKYSGEPPKVIINREVAELTILMVEILLGRGTIHIAIPFGDRKHSNE